MFLVYIYILFLYISLHHIVTFQCADGHQSLTTLSAFILDVTEILWSAFKTFDIHDDGKISKEAEHRERNSKSVLLRTPLEQPSEQF